MVSCLRIRVLEGPSEVQLGKQRWTVRDSGQVPRVQQQTTSPPPYHLLLLPLNMPPWQAQRVKVQLKYVRNLSGVGGMRS